ncbi:hypothetical protein IQ06DRAFT_370133 [Phaeosphaeriaceae sp. SRC1lsM3a]|nr:hypothetical protein IQ06DRAFT_370133 [Stagonospora sp. SRC1lsM3a]
MSFQQHNHPPSLVPARQAPVHRVDSHRALAPDPADSKPTYSPYRSEYAALTERGRKDFNRRHCVIDGDRYGASVADGGVKVPDFPSDTTQAQARTRAWSQPSPHYRVGADASSRPQTRTRQNLSQPQPQMHYSPHRHTHSASYVRAPIPPSIPMSHISLPAYFRAHFSDIPGSLFYKDTSRHDSMNSTGFIQAEQLDNDVPAHLLKHIENPRTKMGQFKQKARQFWHGML